MLLVTARRLSTAFGRNGVDMDSKKLTFRMILVYTLAALALSAGVFLLVAPTLIFHNRGVDPKLLAPAIPGRERHSHGISFSPLFGGRCYVLKYVGRSWDHVIVLSAEAGALIKGRSDGEEMSRYGTYTLHFQVQLHNSSISRDFDLRLRIFKDVALDFGEGFQTLHPYFLEGVEHSIPVYGIQVSFDGSAGASLQLSSSEEAMLVASINEHYNDQYP